MDLGAMREALADGKVWCGIGLVVKRQGDDSHYEIADGDVLVEVDLMPNKEPLLCRLASHGGLWRVPPEGSEVCVLLPDGALDGEPMIVGLLSGGEIDDDLDGDMLLIVNSKKIKIKTTDGDIAIVADDQVILGASSGGKEIARKGDAVDIGSWAIVVNGSGAVTAINVTPPGGGAPVGLSAAPTPLSAKCNAGSSKAKAAD